MQIGRICRLEHYAAVFRKVIIRRFFPRRRLGRRSVYRIYINSIFFAGRVGAMFGHCISAGSHSGGVMRKSSRKAVSKS